jgi:hypothetical protein
VVDAPIKPLALLADEAEQREGTDGVPDVIAEVIRLTDCEINHNSNFWWDVPPAGELSTQATDATLTGQLALAKQRPRG